MALSIVDVPELADHIAFCLSLQDLTSCILVDKAWNAAFVRYIWRTVPPSIGSVGTVDTLWKHFQRHDAIFHLLRDDYLVFRQQQQREGSTQDSNKCSSSSSSSFLSRYGPWIRRVSLNQICLQDDLPLPTSSNTSAAITATANNTNQDATDSKPTAQELMLHLLEHCPNLQSLDLIGWDANNADLDFWRVIATDVVPRLVELCVLFRALNNSNATTVSIPSIILAKCSNRMRKLTIPYTNKSPPRFRPLDMNGESAAGGGVYDGEGGQEDEGLADREEPLLGIKFLEFIFYQYYSPFLSTPISFLKRCSNLETLHVGILNDDWSMALRVCTKLRRIKTDRSDVSTVRLLTNILRTGGLLNLDDIEINFDDIEVNNDDLPDNGVTDSDTAALLSAGHKGWRNVNLSTLGKLTAEVLIQHCATLESLEVRGTPGVTSDHMCHIVSSSPRLHTFITLADREVSYPEVAYFLPEDFIDLDPITNTLRPWACESTLRRFSAKIGGIPRPDVTLTHYGLPRSEDEDGFAVDVLQETYSGQSQELQTRIYERLSRFSRLELLALGHDDRDFENDGRYIFNADGDPGFGDEDFQYDCMAFSLESGLQALESLKGLKELNVFRMATVIDVEEIQWMTRTWPKLENLVGLNVEEVREKNASVWLKENYPKIKSKPCTSYP
ncbi:MAG: hypothetical protein J3R72DRAFT_438590 [Linnemannia gamsii]|nr:MAG: hypothetical protein J3R72DRAFT_438590 [Linnemannia gamsii]